MNSSDLLRLQLSQQIGCAEYGVALGATGPTGPAGPTGPVGTPGYAKMYTIYLKYTNIPLGAGTATVLNSVYIPPGLSTTPSLAAGGTFTANVGTDLVFFQTTNITISNTTFAFPIGLSATGYTASGYWSPSAYSNLGGSSARITWQNTADNQLRLFGLTAANINGANVSRVPSTGVLAGWLGTLTIYYL